MKDYRPAKKRVAVSVGESVRILRELQELSQNQLAERAKVLARALKCHPGVLVFPGWSHEEAA